MYNFLMKYYLILEVGIMISCRRLIKITKKESLYIKIFIFFKSLHSDYGIF